MAHDVFVSYASEDKTVADAVVATLEQEGIRCWVASRDVIPGHGYGEDIVAAIHTSQIVVLLLSSHANGSPTVMRELERAVNDGLPILPLLLEDVTPSGELTYYLSDAHWLDAITPPLEDHVRGLADTIRLLLSRADEERATKPVVAEPTGPGGFVRDHWRWIVAAAAGFVVILAVVAGVLVTRGGGDGEGDDASVSVETSADEIDDTSTTQDPFVGETVEGGSYGDDPFLDDLYDRCDDGDSAACDTLYFRAPIGSEYDLFGSSCGNRQPQSLGGDCEAEETGHYGDDPVLDGLYDLCEAGDLGACDDLYFDSPIDSEYASFAESCGNRGIPSSGLCEEQDGG